MGHGALWVVETVHTVPIAQVAAKRQHENCELTLRCRSIHECQRRGVCTYTSHLEQRVELQVNPPGAIESMVGFCAIFEKIFPPARALLSADAAFCDDGRPCTCTARAACGGVGLCRRHGGLCRVTTTRTVRTA